MFGSWNKVSGPLPGSWAGCLGWSLCDVPRSYLKVKIASLSQARGTVGLVKQFCSRPASAAGKAGRLGLGQAAWVLGWMPERDAWAGFWAAAWAGCLGKTNPAQGQHRALGRARRAVGLVKKNPAQGRLLSLERMDAWIATMAVASFLSAQYPAGLGDQPRRNGFVRKQKT